MPNKKKERKKKCQNPLVIQCPWFPNVEVERAFEGGIFLHLEVTENSRLFMRWEFPFRKERAKQDGANGFVSNNSKQKTHPIRGREAHDQMITPRPCAQSENIFHDQTRWCEHCVFQFFSVMKTHVYGPAHGQHVSLKTLLTSSLIFTEDRSSATDRPRQA